MLSQAFFNNPIKLKRCTSLNINQFTELARRIGPLWNRSEIKRLSRENRKRAMGAGHPYSLKTIQEKLFALLLWYRTYPAYWFLGMIMGIDGSNLCKLFQKLRPLVEQAADPEFAFSLKKIRSEINKKRRKISSWEDLEKYFPEIAEIFTDATEQPKLKPSKNRVQKKYYSGKKKRHTLKTQISIAKYGRILNITNRYPGSLHDYHIFESEGSAKKIPKGSKHFLDKAYVGVKKDYPTLNSLIPVKRTRWKPFLTHSEKIKNKKLAKKRVLVEHIIAKLKKYQLLYQVYRNRVESYNQDFRNIAALVNFRLSLVT